MTHDDDTTLRLHAWLDGELPEADAQSFEARLTEDAALQAEADSFRRTDSLVRDWYRSLSVEAVSPAQPPRHLAFRPWRRWLWSGLLAAAVLFAFIGTTLWPQRSASVSAADFIQQAGERIALAAGLRVEFTSSYTHRFPLPDGGSREEQRTARGEIRFGPITAERLQFRCRESWTVADEPELIRVWGQTATGQWLVEKQGGNVNAEQIEGNFNPAAAREGGLDVNRAGASPVDPRTRQAVEGLALLVRSFRRDSYLNWLGGAWSLEGGLGTKAAPWTYRLEPEAGSTQRMQTVWTVQVTARQDMPPHTPLLDTVEVCETITDSRTAIVQSSFHTVYRLELLDAPWPEKAFQAD